MCSVGLAWAAVLKAAKSELLARKWSSAVQPPSGPDWSREGTVRMLLGSAANAAQAGSFSFGTWFGVSAGLANWNCADTVTGVAAGVAATCQLAATSIAAPCARGTVARPPLTVSELPPTVAVVGSGGVK